MSSSRSLRASVQIFFVLLLFPIHARGEVSSVAIRVPEAQAWTGQRLPFFVDLKTRGSFSGSAGFSLPDIPRTVILKVGNPVVSSEELDGESWFVQTHEFALFSQQSGTVEIPSFQARFGSREGFTGPVADREVMVPGSSIEIRRPPGSENIGFLVTTDSLELLETWDPLPRPSEAGAVFKRTIVQRAGQMTGMALAPAPTTAIPGVRIYPGQPEVSDKMNRGAFLGERRETITYLLQEPGTLELPALTYIWWDPKLEALRTKTFPAVIIEVAPSPTRASPIETTTGLQKAWPWLLVAIGLIVLTAWQRQRIANQLARSWKALNPPERRAARKLLTACHRRDPAAAQDAWNRWRLTQDSRFLPPPALQAAVLKMQRHLFGPSTSEPWEGDELAKALATHRSEAKSANPPQQRSVLPSLNSR